MAEQKVIMTDPRQEDYFYQEATFGIFVSFYFDTCN